MATGTWAKLGLGLRPGNKERVKKLINYLSSSFVMKLISCSVILFECGKRLREAYPKIRF